MAQWSACWAHNPKVPGSKPGSARIWAHKDPHLPWAFPHTHADAAPAAAPLPLLATGKPQQVQGTTGLRGQPATRTAAVGHMCSHLFVQGRSATSGVAQWSACWAHNPKVRGSKPRSATFLFVFGFVLLLADFIFTLQLYHFC